MAWIRVVPGLTVALAAITALSVWPEAATEPARARRTHARQAAGTPVRQVAAAPISAPISARTQAQARVREVPVRDDRAELGTETASAATSTAGSSPFVASDSALANVPPYYVPDAIYPAVRPKGIKVDVRGSYSSDKKSDDGWSHYTQKTTTYGVGLRKDWSVNAIVGVGLDMVDAKVESETFPAKTDISGYVANVNLQTALWDLFPLDFAVRYGRFENDGEYEGYTEKKHTSTLYGASAQVRIPYLTPYSSRVQFGFGLTYDKLNTKSHLAVGPDEVAIPKMSSESMVMPISVYTDKDYALCYGVLTPSMILAYHWEFSESGLGVRNYNAMAAKNHPTMETVNSPSGYVQFGVGLKLATHGGWRAEAGYDYFLASDYRRHNFKLELAKCF